MKENIKKWVKVIGLVGSVSVLAAFVNMFFIAPLFCYEVACMIGVLIGLTVGSVSTIYSIDRWIFEY